MINKRLARIHDYENRYFCKCKAKGSVEMKEEIKETIPQELLDKIAAMSTTRLEYNIKKDYFNQQKTEIKEAMDKLGIQKISHDEARILCLINKGRVTAKIDYEAIFTKICCKYNIPREEIGKIVTEFKEIKRLDPTLSIREKKTNIGPIVTE